MDTKAWREARDARLNGLWTQFPSGKIARIRPISIGALVELGFVPDSLTPLVDAVVSGREAATMGAPTAQQLVDMQAFLNGIVRYAFLEPRVVDNPQADDEIGVNDLEQRDKLFLMQLLEAPVETLKRFRWEPSADVEPLQSVPDERGEAVPDPSAD